MLSWIKDWGTKLLNWTLPKGRTSRYDTKPSDFCKFSGYLVLLEIFMLFLLRRSVEIIYSHFIHGPRANSKGNPDTIFSRNKLFPGSMRKKIVSDSDHIFLVTIRFSCKIAYSNFEALLFSSLLIDVLMK